jgi:spermidine synthase
LQSLPIDINEGDVLITQKLADITIEVKEQLNYRWLATKSLESNDGTFQSIINIKKPTQLVIPYTQTMTLFLLWQYNEIKVLNLGMGVGSIESALSAYDQITFTSIEQSEEVVRLAHNFFNLPKKTHIKITSAEQFLQSADQKYNVILCDLFNNHHHSECIFELDFYIKLQQLLTDTGLIFINLIPEDAMQLQMILVLIRRVFKYVTLAEYADYKNIVLIISSNAIPNKNELTQLNDQNKQKLGIDYSDIIASLLYLPVKP